MNIVVDGGQRCGPEAMPSTPGRSVLLPHKLFHAVLIPKHAHSLAA
jgi:hypothetical protein